MEDRAHSFSKAECCEDTLRILGQANGRSYESNTEEGHADDDETIIDCSYKPRTLE